MNNSIYDPYSQFERIQFNNGFELYFLNTDRPWIRGTFLLRAGAKDNPVGKSGLAHFVEHLVLENHDSMSFEDLINFFDNFGGNLSAFSDIKKTTFNFFIPNTTSVFLKTIDIFSNLLLSNKIGNNFEKQRNIINNEINEVYSDNKIEYLHSFMKFIFQDTQLKGLKLPSGSIEEFNDLSLEDCNRFYFENYKPKKIILVLVGCIDDKIKSIIKKSKFTLGDQKEIEKELKDFEMNSFNKQETIIFKKSYFAFLSKSWKLSFVLDFSVNKYVLNIHREMLYKTIFSKFREQFNMNYSFTVNIEIWQGLYIYKIYFPLNSSNYSQIEFLFEDCMISLNNNFDLFVKSKNSLINSNYMFDSDFSSILLNSVNELSNYGKIKNLTETVIGYKSVNFTELKEFNNFLFTKTNRYIEIVK